MDSQKTRAVQDRDNDRLQPETAGPFVIGMVDEVNGPGAAEVPEFVPTTHELTELVRYWAGVRLGRALTFFDTGTIGSTDTRRMDFAGRRIKRVADLIGKARVDAILDEVEQGVRSDYDAKTWGIFQRGNQGEWDAHAEDVLTGRTR